MAVRNEEHLVLDKVFARIFSNLKPDLDREVNLFNFILIYPIFLDIKLLICIEGWSRTDISKVREACHRQKISRVLLHY